MTSYPVTAESLNSVYNGITRQKHKRDFPFLLTTPQTVCTHKGLTLITDLTVRVTKSTTLELGLRCWEDVAS